MKKIFVSVFLVVATFFLSAQQTNSFPTEHDKFLKELNQFMTAGKIETNVKTMEDFQKLVKDGKITSAWLDQIITTSNAMAARMMAPAPHFFNYLNAVINAQKNSKTDSQFNDWNKLLTDVIANQKKGDNNDFLKLIEFSNGFFQQNALNITAAKMWKVETSSYTFSYENNKPKVSFPTTSLLGCVKGDTLSIQQTAGDYYPLEGKWEGKSGKVDWKRAGIDPGKVYCTFKNYNVSVSNFNYTVDTVTFYHSDYFKQPLRGKLIDKMVSSADSNSMTYPRFESYDVGMTIKDLAPNVTYTGGFSMHGNKVIGYGSADEKAQLTFFSRDGKTKIMSARVQTLLIKKGEELGADKAEVSIYFGNDSIYHPQLNLVYKIPKREVRLLRGETGVGKAKFNDSYHNHEFQTDAIFWNLDSTILNLKILSGVGQKPGVYESINYFNKELIRKTQGFASYEPLSVLKKLYEKNGFREINSVDFARALDPNLKETEVKSLLYQLLEGGFIQYNEDLGVITIKDKAINYVLANAKKIDYDIIRIKSAPQSGNDYIDVKNNNIDLKGVFEVPISDTAYVYIRPKANSISLQKDRNMEFDGLLYAGRMDFVGEKYKFNYSPFTVDLNKVDTMRLNIPDSNKVDAYGDPILKPMKSRVEGIKGLLEIDAPINKSGRTRLPQFPRLYSRDKSYIYYDDPAIAKGAYTRKNFFFELEPFRLDSLNNFSPDIINWKGKLVSGGIFPDIKDSVHLQRDESLGFKSETPPGGYDLYKGKGRYYGNFELNYSGLQGDGRITHSTADFKTNDVRLYPDSMRATTDTFRLAKTFEGVKTPAVIGTSDMIFWKPVTDSMHITMLDKDKPFAMYDDGFTTFKGSLLLTDKGLRGTGTLDWNEATLESKDFSFRTMDLAADTASLNIKTTGDKVTFKTPNVSAKVDFKTRIGDFVSNQKNIPTEFSYNKYSTAINQFKWFMDEKILDFKAPPAGPGEFFTSTKPEQKGLKFLGKRATYNLVTSLLRVEQVPEIKVADASVVPDSGVVIIEEDAKMHQLRNATIYADTLKKYHKIDNAIVDIFSKEDLKGTGEYTYNTKGTKEVISLNDISCKKETEGERKKAHDIFHLVAKATLEESKNFILYPDVTFNGDVTITSVNPLLNFKGYTKIGLKNTKASTTDFFIHQDVDPNRLELKYDSVKNSFNNKVSAGIHINPQPGTAGIYATLMSPKQNGSDLTVFNTKGIITQTNTGEYFFGDSNKIKNNALTGNIIRYDDKKGVAKAEGKFNLGFNFGTIKQVAAGNADVELDSGKYKLNLTLGLNAEAGDKIQERLEFYMAGDNADQPDLIYDKDKQRKAVHELADEKDDKKLLEEFEKTTAFTKRPKGFNYNLVFSDVNFVFDSDDISLRSVGKIGVAMVGKKSVNKKLEGYIEMQYKGGLDAFTIYLQTGTKNWFYFEYKPGTLGLLTSYDDINKLITSVAPEKRKVKGDKNRFYLYSLASSLNKQDFTDYMKDKAAGIHRPRPEPRIETPVFIDTAAILEGDTSTSVPVEEKQRIEQQQEINQIEQMRMNNQSILSGPPPDRNQKPAQDSVQQPETPKPDTVPQLNEHQAPSDKLEQMKINNEPVLSGAPLDRQTPPADTVKTEVPAQEIIAPKTETPKADTVQQPVQQITQPVQNPVPDTPKQDSIPAAPVVVPDAIKTDTIAPK